MLKAIELWHEENLKSLTLTAATHIELPDLFYSNLSGKNVKGEIPSELNNMDELAEL